MNKKSIIYRCLVASLCIVSMIVMTYSWFNRPNGASANSMSFDRVMDLNDNGTNIKVVTEYSTDDGKTYTESLSRSDTGELGSITTKLGPGGKLYFRTTVKNTGTTKKTNVTVDLENSSFPEGIYIGTTSPINSEKSVSTTEGSVTIAKNVAVSNTDGAVIDWYIYFSSDEEELTNITLGNLLVYQV
ncbi:MAG: hypothetical protein ACI4HL_00870 [Ruminococcus sp.]